MCRRGRRVDNAALLSVWGHGEHVIENGGERRRSAPPGEQCQNCVFRCILTNLKSGLSIGLAHATVCGVRLFATCDVNQWITVVLVDLRNGAHNARQNHT